MKTIFYTIIIVVIFASCEKQVDQPMLKSSNTDSVYTVKITNSTYKHSFNRFYDPKDTSSSSLSIGVYVDNKWHSIGDSTFFIRAKSVWYLSYNKSIYFKTKTTKFKLTVDINRTGMSNITHVTDWISSDIKEYIITDNIVLKPFTEW